MKDTQIQALMDHYPLQQWAHNPTLRSVCTPVWPITKELRQFGKDLLALMWAYDGVWLAAPQVGKTIRMAAVTQRDTSRKERELTLEDVMINPVVLSSSDTHVRDKEWCLSLPGIEWEVERSKQITVKYTNLQGKDIIKKISGYNARIILHEIDHLDWVLFIDKLAT